MRESTAVSPAENAADAVDTTPLDGAMEVGTDDVPVLLRPSLRGSMHRWSVPVAITLTVLLAVRAGNAADRAAAIVYGLCVSGMLATSGLYHSARFAARERRFLRRLDHSMILVGISGTYTAVIVLALTGPVEIVLLSVAWALAVIGVTIRMRWLDAPSGVVAAVYLVAGWQMLIDLPAYEAAMTAAELSLLAVGGGLYTVGAIIYAFKRPNPWPAVFGYHEVFHTLVVAAAMCHWVAVWLIAAE